MKNNREMEGPKYKKKERKRRKINKGKGMWHVGKSGEASSCLKYN